MIWALYMIAVMPNGVPVTLRNIEEFQTEEQCLEVGKVKAPDIAQDFANNSGFPIRFFWKCVNEKSEQGVAT